jgi:hypothetical protein
MYAPCPGRSPARQENIFFGKITAGLFIHWMIKRKLENFPERLCSLPEQSIPKPAFYVYTKSNLPGSFTPLHEPTSSASSPKLIRSPATSAWDAISHFAWGHPATSTRLFEGSRHFLLIFASLRNRFIFFDCQQLMFAHHYAPTDNHRFHIVSLQRIG